MGRTEHQENSGIIGRLRQRAGPANRMGFAEFMEVALYDPEFGYYRRDRRRVGRETGTDFFTATSTGTLFGEAIVGAAVRLLEPEDPARFIFHEIGAEHGRSVLDGVAHPFAGVRTMGAGDSIAIEGRAVVFSNELFDAQPFRRFRWRTGSWHELGVALEGCALREVELPDPVAESWLPASAPEEGYVLDAPRAAVGLMTAIASQPWHGLLLACDYGLPWSELSGSRPLGTARAYRRHAQSNDLLALPGEQDLTCHVCWDWLADALRDTGFREPVLESLEAFLVRCAGSVLAGVAATEATRMSPRKAALQQLLSPATFGQKFQVLHARR